VHAGRVLVTVQETSFRISKGGIFIVPRCKFSFTRLSGGGGLLTCA